MNENNKKLSTTTAWSSSLRLGWSTWSEWSECPQIKKNCNEPFNIQYQLRRCLDNYCSGGSSSRYRLCFLNENCFSFNSLTKTCKISSTNLTKSQQILHNFTFLNTYFLPNGFPCQLPSFTKSVCFQGYCQPVGCDKIIGSLAKEDQCGICGGNGKSCFNNLFKWKESGHFSKCKGKCGNNGISVSVSVCVNNLNQRIVPDRLCKIQKRPRPKIKICSTIICISKWQITNWSDCSVSCGLGEQKREVYCAEVDDKGQQHKHLSDQHCWHSKRPIEIRQCNIGACPEWAIGDWGHCSKAICGRGIRSRPVECRSEGKRLPDWQCLLDGKQQKPPKSQPCWTGIPCEELEEKQKNNRLIEQQRILSYSEENIDKEKEEENEKNGNKPKFFVGLWSECSTSCGPGIRSRQVECMAKQIKLTDYECQGQSRPIQFRHCQIMPCSVATQKNDPSPSLYDLKSTVSDVYRWKHGRWTVCSSSCLGGQQRLPLICIELSTGKTVSYSKCEEETSGAGKKPEELIRQCNQQPCPPNWEISDWSICSHFCGGGLRTRQIRCIQLIAKKGPESTLLLPDIKCPGERPVNEEPCGMVDCAPEWKVGNWSQCSTNCGLGEQKRSINCIQRDSLGKIEEKPIEECIMAANGERPIISKECNNLVNCPLDIEEEKEQNNLNSPINLPFIYSEPFKIKEKSAKDQPLSDNENEEDLEEEEEENKNNQPRKLTLQIGGIANLYEGTSVKVKCPVKNIGNKRKIIWTVNGRPLRQSSRLKISKNGALRIFNSRQHDAGIYACYNIENENKQLGNVTLKFKIDKENKIKNNKQMANKKLLQRIRNSLYNNGQYSFYERIASATKDPSQIRFEFTVSDWSNCEQLNCLETEGIKTRQIFCKIFFGNESENLEDLNICEDFGALRPLITKECLNIKCARWEIGKWSECNSSRCFKQSTALQKREVKCVFGNKTEANPILCLRKTRPKLKRECQNLNCSADWRPSVWGKCSKQCGDGGVQMRLLRCVWKGTKKPAGQNCNQTKRPIAIRACLFKRKLPECFLINNKNENKEEEINEEEKEQKSLRLCEDQSRFCDILRLFQTCDQPKIRSQCCYSCRKLIEELNKSYGK